MADSQVDIELRLIVGQATAAIQQLTTQVAGLDKSLSGGAKGIKDVAGATDLLDRQLRRTTISAEIFRGIIGANLFFRIGKSIVNGIGGAVQSMIDFESALIGVGKTTDLQGSQLEELGKEIQELGNRIPVPTNELLRLAQVAAQLGVARVNLVKFVETAARLGTSTNVSAEDAITALTRLTLITKGSQGDVDRLASSLVALGNKFATTESEILSMSDQLSRSTSGFGLTGEQVLGISAAMTSMGIAAEGGGSAAGAVFERLAKVISQGGPDLEKFAKLTGNTSQELKDKFAKNAAGAFGEIIAGLNKASGSSVELSQLMTELGFVNVRVRKTIRPLTTAQEEFLRATTLSAEAFKENLALLKESNTRFQTTESQIQLLKNGITQLAVSLTTGLNPGLKLMTEYLAGAAKYWSKAFNADPLEQNFVKAATRTNELRNQITELQNRINSLSANGGPKLTEIGRSLELSDARTSLRKLNVELEKAVKLEKIAKDAFDLQESQKSKDKDSKTIKPATTPGGLDSEIANEQIKSELLNQIQLDRVEATDNYWLLRNQIEDEQVEIALQRDIDRIDAEEALRIADIQNSTKSALDKKLAIAKVEEDTIKQKTDRVKREVDLEDRKNKEIEQSRNQFLGTMAGLARNENSTLKAIGKAAAATQIGINTVQSASSGYKWGMTLGGPALAAVFQGLAYVAGAAQLAELAKYRDGGVVGGNSFSGDQVVARVNSGEMILNRAQQANLMAMANGRPVASGGQEIVVNSTVTLDGEVVGRAVSRQVANGLKLGEVL